MPRVERDGEAETGPEAGSGERGTPLAARDRHALRSAMARRFNFVFRRFEKRFFGHFALEPEVVSRLKALEERGSVIYVMRYSSRLDYFLFNVLFLRHGLREVIAEGALDLEAPGHRANGREGNQEGQHEEAQDNADPQLEATEHRLTDPLPGARVAARGRRLLPAYVT